MIHLTQKLLVLFVLSLIFLFAIVFLVEFSSESSSGKILVLDMEQVISVKTEVSDLVHVGEPFDYKIIVGFRSDKIKPDFTQLLRDVRISPFEQIHRSRTTIIENDFSENYREYAITYSIVGIDVVPGKLYTLGPVKVNYTEIGRDKIDSIMVEPKSVTIDMYSVENAIEIPFQPLRGVLKNNAIYKQITIISCLFIFLFIGVVSVWNSVRRRHFSSQSVADKLRNKFNEVRNLRGGKRQKVILFEKIILSFFKHYGNQSAKIFWSRKRDKIKSFWQEQAKKLKQPFESAYSYAGPLEKDIQIIEENFENVCLEIEPESAKERLNILDELEGTRWQRIARKKVTFVCGIAGLFISLIFLYLLISPKIWMDKDVITFNDWLEILPERLLEETNNHDLGLLDVEMLENISDQKQVLENLEADSLKSAYLYNYGTLVGKVYKVVLTMPSQDEEEATEPPSFEFPVQLLANAARYYPYDEDVRRNLEIAIRLKESQDNTESGEVQGELGPPTPGFSRDMNPVLF